MSLPYLVAPTRGDHIDAHHGRPVIVSALRVRNQVIRSGDSIRCIYPAPELDVMDYYGESEGGNLTGKRSRSRDKVYVLLNAMVWPTLLFVAGFLALFFACILLAQDRLVLDSRLRRSGGMGKESVSLVERESSQSGRPVRDAGIPLQGEV